MNLRKLARDQPCHKVDMTCATCKKSYRKRADRVRAPDYCSLPCRKAATVVSVLERARHCQHCDQIFTPRQGQLRLGQGRYCSLKCSTTASIGARNGPEAKAKAVATYRRNGHDVRQSMIRGPLHPDWAGGPVAARRRFTQSGKAKEALRRYRAENPHRVREWSQRRDGRKTGRLPRGTIPELLTLQRNRCAGCAARLDGTYHVDHIMPLGLGGKHERGNIQLLCRTCNVRKWMLHPVDFAQRNGRLL